MKVLVTGATGFVGRWLTRELASAGHESVGTPPSADLDITDGAAVQALVDDVRPHAVAHLAAVAFGPDARRDPELALRVNVGGARSIMEAVAALAAPIPVLIAGSSDVYGDPEPTHLPLRESAPLRTVQPYGRSKLAQERVATELSLRHTIPLVITRAFNHTGPGQRREFVVPALAARILAARAHGQQTIRAGNIDVRRDIGDVRDVVRAYRLLIEAAARQSLPPGEQVYNVATGRSVAIREVIARLAGLAGVSMEIETDPALVRRDDPAEITGDASRLAAAVGWQPEIDFDRTLADILADVSEARS